MDDKQLNQKQPWLSSIWFRRRYEVRGQYICPDTSIPVEAYNPFDSFVTGNALFGARSVRRTGDGTPPYQELAELGRLFDPKLRRKDGKAHPKAKAAVEQFTATYGPLGLLQHHLLQIRYVSNESGEILAKHGPPLGLQEVLEGPSYHEVLVHSSDTEYAYRTIHAEILQQGWGDAQADGSLVIRPETGLSLDEAWRRAEQGLRHKELLAWLNDGSKNGEVLAEDPLDPGYHSYGVESYFGYFFPCLQQVRHGPIASLGDLPAYPSPRSPVFWDHYVEHLAWFELAAREFRRTVQVVIRWENASVDEVNWLKRQFDRHLRHVQPVPVIQGKAPGERLLAFSFPSLLAACYMMLCLEFTHNRSLGYCANERCGRAFAADRPDQMYCSESCKGAQKQRTYRRRLKKMTGGA